MKPEHWWTVEFLHSLGWTPIGDLVPNRDHARAELSLYRGRSPRFKYRITKMVRAADRNNDAPAPK